MATIYKLVTQLTADPRPMQEGVDRGTKILRDFGRSAASVINDIPKSANLTQGFIGAGTDAATSLLAALEKTFNSRQSELREAFARGSLNKAQFEELGAEAAKSFNTALLNSLNNRAFKKIISPEAREDLVNALKTSGIAGATEIDRALEGVGGRLRSFGRDLSQTGRELTLALTTPIVAGTVAALAASDNFEHAVDHIRVSTGKVGPALDGMELHLRSLFAALPNSAEEIAKALATISIFSGATGRDLDEVARTVLNLSRITGTDLTANVESTQRAFRGWGVAASDQVREMDVLFRTSQQTGVAVSDLAGTLARFEPAFHQLGLGFGEAATLIGQFQKNGIDADTVLTTLQTSLSRFAAKGLDGHEALALLVHDIKAAGSEAEATNLASRIFGGREAAQLSNAIRNGTLDLEQLTRQVALSGITINGTADRVDEFGARLSILGHAASGASKQLGDVFKQEFIAFQPVLVAGAQTVSEFAGAFLSLPRPILTGAGAIVTFLAAAGPLTLILGGLTKGIGATVLAFGLLKDARAAIALAGTASAAAQAAGSMTEAESAALKLATGLDAIGKVSVVLVALGALVELWDLFTRDARNAQEELDRFKSSLDGLSQKQLTIKTDQAQREIALRTQQLDDFKKKFAEATSQEFDTSGQHGALDAFTQLGGIAVSKSQGLASIVHALGTDDPFIKMAADVQEYNRQLGIATGKANEIKQASIDNAESERKLAQARADFNKSINDFVTQQGVGVTVDPEGAAIGSLRHLQDEATKLRRLLHSTEPLTVPTQVAELALSSVEEGIDRITIKGHSIRDTFPQLSQSMKDIETEVSALLSRVRLLGQSFEQLSNAKLNAALVSSFEDVDRLAKSFGESMSLDAQKARELRDQLKGAFVIQIETNATKAQAFTVDVIGNVVRLDTSHLEKGADFGQLVDAGLQNIRVLAEQVQAAQEQLAVATASGNLFAIQDAQRALERYYALANEGEQQYRTAVTRSNVSIAQREAAFKALDALNSQFGIDAAKLNVTPGVSADDIQNVIKSAQSLIDNLASPHFTVIPILDRLDLQNAVSSAQSQLVDSQLAALSGHQGAAEALKKAALDTFAATQKQDAQLALTGPVNQRAEALKLLEERAKAAGFSLEEVGKSLDEQRNISQVIKIADAFSTAATAAFGANSAVATFAGGIDTAAKSAKQLIDIMHSLGTPGGKVDFAGLFSGVVGVVTGVIGAIQAVGSLFAKSQAQIERDQIEKDNTQALRDLRAAIDNESNTVGRAADLARALAETNVNNPHFQQLIAQSEQQNGFSVGPNAFTNFSNAFVAVLGEFNLTLDQAASAAKALGITLLDSAGHVIPDSAKAFVDAMQLQIQRITQLGTDFSAQQKRLQVAASLAGGNETAQQKLNDSVTAFAKTLDTHGGDLGKQLEAASAQGPQQLRDFLKHLFDLAQSNFFTNNPQLLGSFTDINQFTDALLGTSDELNALADASKNVTDSMTNVPTVFKKALEEFNAQAAQRSPALPPPPPPPPAPPPTDTTPTRPPDTTALLDIVRGVLAAFPQAANTVTTASSAKFASTLDALTKQIGSSSDVLAKAPATLTDSLAKPTDALSRFTKATADAATLLEAIVSRGTLPGNTDPLSTGGPVDKRQVDVGALVSAISAHAKENAASATGSGISSVPRETHIHIGTLALTSPAKNARELFADVKRTAQQVAREKTGDSTQVVAAFQE